MARSAEGLGLVKELSRNSQAAANIQRQEAVQVSDVVSGEEIKKAADSSAQISHDDGRSEFMAMAFQQDGRERAEHGDRHAAVLVRERLDGGALARRLLRRGDFACVEDVRGGACAASRPIPP